MQLAIRTSMVQYRNNLKRILPNRGGRLVSSADYHIVNLVCFLTRISRKVFSFSHGCSKHIMRQRLYARCNDWRSTAASSSNNSSSNCNSSRTQARPGFPATTPCNIESSRRSTPIISTRRWGRQATSTETAVRVVV